jgi:hypothetical protein
VAAARACSAEMLPPLVRAPLRGLLSSFLRTLRPRMPYAIGGSDFSLLLVPLYAHPVPYRTSKSRPAASAWAASGSRRGMIFCTRAADVGDEASSSAAAASSDLSAPYLSVRIRCRKQDAVSMTSTSTLPLHLHQHELFYTLFSHAPSRTRKFSLRCFCALVLSRVRWTTLPMLEISMK